MGIRITDLETLKTFYIPNRLKSTYLRKILLNAFDNDTEVLY